MFVEAFLTIVARHRICLHVTESKEIVGHVLSLHRMCGNGHQKLLGIIVFKSMETVIEINEVIRETVQMPGKYMNITRLCTYTLSHTHKIHVIRRNASKVMA